MKTYHLIALFIATLLFSACAGGGGPGEQAGRTADRAVQSAGRVVEGAGETIQNVAR